MNNLLELTKEEKEALSELSKQLSDMEKKFEENPKDKEAAKDYALALVDQLFYNNTLSDSERTSYQKKLPSVAPKAGDRWNHYCQAYLNFLEGRIADTLTHFKGFIKTSTDVPAPDSDKLDAWLEIFYPEPENWWETLESVMEETWPGSAASITVKGMRFLGDEDYEQALDCFVGALSKDESFWFAARGAGDAYYYDSNWESAVRYYKRALKSEGAQAKPDIYFDLAWSYGKLKQLQAEEEAYRKCMALNPQWEYVKNNLGYCLQKQGRYQEAISLFDECIRLGVDGKFPRRNKAACLAKLGRYEEAIKLWENDIRGGKLTKAAETEITKLRALLSKNQTLELSRNEIVASIDSGSGNPEEYSYEDELESSTDVRFGQGTEIGKVFEREKTLEDLLEVRMKQGQTVFGRRLKVFETDDYYGRQLAIPGIGRIDLLAVDEDTNDLIVIELKRNKSEDHVVGQVLRYIGWVRKELAGKDQKVRGLICLGTVSETLSLSASAASDVEVFTYDFSFRKVI